MHERVLYGLTGDQTDVESISASAEVLGINRITRHYALTGSATAHVCADDNTRISVDAIVNATNERMLGGSGVDGTILAAAGQ